MEMGNPRSCGCKGVRTCLQCESEFGAVKRQFSLNEDCRSFVYCALCKKAWKGWNRNILDEHPNHSGESIEIPGIYIELDFLTLEEQALLIQEMDSLAWDLSQSGRRKQNYGPKCNFKKRRMKPGDFNGFPKFTQFIQQRFQSVSLLEGFHTIEQCSLEYKSERGASIDPHIDDCWVWGERVVTVNVIGDSMLTLNRYLGTHERYNLADVRTYPRVVNDDGKVVWKPHCSESGNMVTAKSHENGEGSDSSQSIRIYSRGTDDSLVKTTSIAESDDEEDIRSETYTGKKNVKLSGDCCVDRPQSMRSSLDSYQFSESSGNETDLPIIRVPMPARSLLVIYGAARYEWEHSVLREDIMGRRVCLAYREFTPPFLKGGLKGSIGSEVQQRAVNFW